MGPTQPNVTPAVYLGKARIPRDCRVYAIGDIHGRADLLARMAEMIRADVKTSTARRHVLIFLGDYIDRGPESFEVIDLLAAEILPDFEIYYLKGNHEDFLLQYLEDGSDLGDWLANGGEETLKSYGIDPGATSPSELDDAIPDSHMDFFKSLKTWHQEGDCLFVHAGVRPGVTLEKQREHDLMWIRNAFLDYEESFGALVVHGHSISPEPEVCANRVGIDTGAYATGRLTCLVLENNEYRFLQT